MLMKNFVKGIIETMEEAFKNFYLFDSLLAQFATDYNNKKDKIMREIMKKYQGNYKMVSDQDESEEANSEDWQTDDSFMI